MGSRVPFEKNGLLGRHIHSCQAIWPFLAGEKKGIAGTSGKRVPISGNLPAHIKSGKCPKKESNQPFGLMTSPNLSRTIVRLTNIIGISDQLLDPFDTQVRCFYCIFGILSTRRINSNLVKVQKLDTFCEITKNNELANGNLKNGHNWQNAGKSPMDVPNHQPTTIQIGN